MHNSSIKEESLLSGLVKRGYFPWELPPPFTTASFGAYAVATKRPITDGDRWTQCARHNLARPGGVRRPLHIPNPLSYWSLAEVLDEGWSTLHELIGQSTISASHLKLEPSGRAIGLTHRQRDLPQLRASKRSGARYLLLADVANFYPSLYTHTVPWAIHGKTACKQALRDKGKGRTMLGNRIDRALLSLNEGQTHGIPIGPDSSLIVAEVLMAAVDVEFRHHHKGVQGYRHVDDYEFAFRSLSEAEAALSTLQGVLDHYQLRLNPRKTRIVDLPQELKAAWAIELEKFLIRPDTRPVGQRNDILSFFSRAFELARNNPAEAVLTYAVARVHDVAIHADNWPTFQSCIMDSVIAAPSSIPRAFGALFSAAKASGQKVDNKTLREACESIIERHATLGEGSEVAWALWATIAWLTGLSRACARSVSTMADDVVALLALHLERRGLVLPGYLDKDHWAAMLNEPDVYSSNHWLLAYEATHKGWLNSDQIKKEPAFLAMSQAGVSFYDEDRVHPMFHQSFRNPLSVGSLAM